MRIAVALFALVLPVSTSACAFNEGPENPFEMAGRADMSLTVTNDHPLDVRISVLRGEIAVPLGRVDGLSAATLRLDGSQFPELGLIQFEIRETAGSGEPVVTWPVLAGPGHPIVLRVNHGLERSYVTVS